MDRRAFKDPHKATRPPTAEEKERLRAWGRRSGICCYCGRKLKTPASLEAGIGPDCALRHGWNEEEA